MLYSVVRKLESCTFTEPGGYYMLAELKQKSQVTIPKDIVKKFSLSVGDKFEVFEKDGLICLMPVVVYPKAYVDELKDELENVKKQIKNGEQSFESVDDLFNALEEDSR